MCTSGLIYDGSILRTGIPRCDVLFNRREEMRRKYRERHGLCLDASILLYAPTFRGGSQKGRRSVNAETGTMDFERLVHALEEKFGGTWYIFLRLHPQVANQAETIMRREQNDRLINASAYPDMNELLAASDMLITDYSSSAFESMLMKQPGFLFVEDEQEYVEDRGELMFQLEELPFPVAYDMDELGRQIADFDQSRYEERVERNKNKIRMYIYNFYVLRRMYQIRVLKHFFLQESSLNRKTSQNSSRKFPKLTRLTRFLFFKKYFFTLTRNTPTNCFLI